MMTGSAYRHSAWIGRLCDVAILSMLVSYIVGAFMNIGVGAGTTALCSAIMAFLLSVNMHRARLRQSQQATTTALMLARNNEILLTLELSQLDVKACQSHLAAHARLN